MKSPDAIIMASAATPTDAQVQKAMDALQTAPGKSETLGSAFVKSVNQSTQSFDPVWLAVLLLALLGLVAVFWAMAKKKEIEEADKAADTEVPSFSEIERAAMLAGEKVEFPSVNNNMQPLKPDPRLSHPEKLRNP